MYIGGQVRAYTFRLINIIIMYAGRQCVGTMRARQAPPPLHQPPSPTPTTTTPLIINPQEKRRLHRSSASSYTERFNTAVIYFQILIFGTRKPNFQIFEFFFF